MVAIAVMLCQLGERVLITAETNRNLDDFLRKLKGYGPGASNKGIQMYLTFVRLLEADC